MPFSIDLALLVGHLKQRDPMHSLDHSAAEKNICNFSTARQSLWPCYHQRGSWVLTSTSTLTLIQPASMWTHWATLRRHSRLLRSAASSSSQVNLILCRSFWPLQFVLGRPCPVPLEIQGPDFRKILQKSYEKLKTKLCKTYYDDITGLLRKRKIRGKWCDSGNPLSEAVIGRILWAKK